ncbi:16S rRNA (cytosine(1402)-N(4))-methyltransferase RsmH [Limibacillus halophilus]|uniref:Ribosomal RNA small subunit methyltransferase H n=1 Tax=Limibacillus halophilus TaxID=1579333 RepID=A0A839SSU3_9PROT|nr:16S rRNA (cytosine(1402)-N(4))-methyltransferase RsmH [Limibacillus halophilus]MBB3064854.1 16S rRNA (cytosine1402-N4)-methyltransferase [Limibacillus halophilus]
MTNLTQDRHAPVMLREVLETLVPHDGGRYLDGTFGAGGYTRGILEAANCRVWAIDRDPTALAAGAALVKAFDGRLTLLAGCFGEMDRLLHADGVEAVEGVALDIGVSSMQIDEAERGFSFRHDGPLDMRMGGEGATAADVVNDQEEAALADIIYRYGEERQSRRIARAIVAARQEAPITRTLQLAEVVRGAIRGGGAQAIDPATRTFQALRIYVNDELGELERGLAAAESLLAPNGRLVVVSFHSLEDRIVKSFLRARSGGEGGSRHLPQVQSREAATLELLFKGALKPSDEEIRINPRARSARLRAARKREGSFIEGGRA